MPDLPRVWVNGRLLDDPSGGVSPVDHGLVVGDGAFETVEIVAGEPFALTRHHRRLDRSLAGLGLAPLDWDRMNHGIREVLADAPPIAFGRLRYFVTGGPGALGSERVPDGQATYVAAAGALAPHPPSYALHVVPWVRNERAATAGLKSTSDAENVSAYAAAKRAGGGGAIFANSKGELCEGTGSNIFVVIDGVIRTPPLSSGALSGVTRELLLEWAAQDGLTIREEDLPLSVLQTADEVFITSTTRAVMPVHRVDDRAIPIGPLTRRAAELFAARAAQGLDP
ncbi:MAG: aminotransferase class IV family protein [Actinomycetales bacterium]|nr:aminotransferase class IV family protein [Candidatus Phosphoribacter baldrii]